MICEMNVSITSPQQTEINAIKLIFPKVASESLNIIIRINLKPSRLNVKIPPIILVAMSGIMLISAADIYIDRNRLFLLIGKLPNRSVKRLLCKNEKQSSANIVEKTKAIIGGTDPYIIQ